MAGNSAGNSAGKKWLPLRRWAALLLTAFGIALLSSAAIAATRRTPPDPERLLENSKQDPELLAGFEEVARDVAPSVVRLRGADGEQQVLGTIVDEHGSVLTKASELSGSISALYPDGITRNLTIAGIAAQHDLALLRVDDDQPTVETTPAKFVNEVTVHVGEFLISVGPEADRLDYGVLSTPPMRIPYTAAFLGIMMENDPINGGVNVTQVTPYSAAERAELEVGDRITAVDGVAVRNRGNLVGVLMSRNAGDRIEITAMRDDQMVSLDATLGTRPRGSERAIVQNQFGSFFSSRAAGFASVLQHDTVLTPNEMGGPIFTLDGEIVGLNIARAGRVETYALPASIINAVLPDLLAGRYRPDADTQPDPSEQPMASE